MSELDEKHPKPSGSGSSVSDVEVHEKTVRNSVDANHVTLESLGYDDAFEKKVVKKVRSASILTCAPMDLA